MVHARRKLHDLYANHRGEIAEEGFETLWPGPGWLCRGECYRLHLERWEALTRYLEDGDLPIDNNHVENRIRPGLGTWP